MLDLRDFGASWHDTYVGESNAVGVLCLFGSGFGAAPTQTDAKEPGGPPCPFAYVLSLTQVVERFVGHYVFCLGLSRFFSCAHWILQVCQPTRHITYARDVTSVSLCTDHGRQYVHPEHVGLWTVAGLRFAVRNHPDLHPG